MRFELLIHVYKKKAETHKVDIQKQCLFVRYCNCMISRVQCDGREQRGLEDRRNGLRAADGGIDEGVDNDLVEPMVGALRAVYLHTSARKSEGGVRPVDLRQREGAV